MNVVAQVDRTRHPFLDGKTKRLLIDGKWVEAASGKTFASHQSRHRRGAGHMWRRVIGRISTAP